MGRYWVTGYSMGAISQLRNGKYERIDINHLHLLGMAFAVPITYFLLDDRWASDFEVVRMSDTDVGGKIVHMGNRPDIRRAYSLSFPPAQQTTLDFVRLVKGGDIELHRQQIGEMVVSLTEGMLVLNFGLHVEFLSSGDSLKFPLLYGARCFCPPYSKTDAAFLVTSYIPQQLQVA